MDKSLEQFEDVVEAMSDRQRFIELGWKILECKYAYYILSRPLMEDRDYDIMEKEYEELGKKLGEEPTASDMVDFKIDRPCARIVMAKVDWMFNKPTRKKKKKC